jgi:AcrR family transcriptional regulator
MVVSTRDRVLDAALGAFGTRGFDGTSLDDLAADLGITKQAILYHFSSKDRLLGAVIDRTAGELVKLYEQDDAPELVGFDRISSVVRTTFRVAARRPELLGLLRQVSRLGDPHTTRLAGGMNDLMERARSFLEHEMSAGRLRRHEPRLLLLSAYSAVLGVASEPEVMRAMGVEPNLRSLAQARAEITAFLRNALVP